MNVIVDKRLTKKISKEFDYHDDVSIFVDGSYLKLNYNVSSYAFAVFKKDEKQFTEKNALYVETNIIRESKKSSVHAELNGLIILMDFLKENLFKNVIIYHDFNFKVYGTSNYNYKENLLANHELNVFLNKKAKTEKFYKKNNCNLDFVLVKSHSKNKGNNLVDRIARKTAKNYQIDFMNSNKMKKKKPKRNLLYSWPLD